MTQRRVTTDPRAAKIAWPPTHSIRPQPPLTQTPTIHQIGAQNIPQNRVIRAVQSDWASCAAETLLEWLGHDRARQFLEMIDKIGFGDLAPVFAIDHLRALLRSSPRQVD